MQRRDDGDGGRRCQRMTVVRRGKPPLVRHSHMWEALDGQRKTASGEMGRPGGGLRINSPSYHHRPTTTRPTALHGTHYVAARARVSRRLTLGRPEPAPSSILLTPT